MSDPCGNGPRSSMDDLESVEGFGVAMYDKLRVNAHKAHWSTVTNDWLLARLMEEVGELVEAMDNDGDVRGECVDVANFAMMIFENGGGICR